MKIIVEKFLKTAQLSSDCLAISDFAFDSKKKKKDFSLQLIEFDKNLKGLIIESIESEDFDFELGKVLIINLSSQNKTTTAYQGLKKIILVGLGPKDKADRASERKAAAALIRAVQKTDKLAVKWQGDAAILAEASILLNYKFDRYKTDDKKPKPKELVELRILLDSLADNDKKAVNEAKIIAESVAMARDLVWEPACEVTPTYLANYAKKIVEGKNNPLILKILEKKDCEKLGMGSFLAVAQGADEPPKFIEFSYKPTGKIKKHIALIGKGVTFDSGGLSLKPAKSMEMMKEDMAGSAAIMGIMNAVATLKPKEIQITAIVAATENMPSGKAYRPGDVITAMNGKTIEVNNTDAEGRLTLADAVAYASKKNPDEIIDFATLTGACMVALGNVCAGLMTNDQDLLDRVKKSSEATGELMWQLPLYEEYKEGLKSTIADLINAGSGGKAGAQNGGLFIQEFVGKQKDSDKAIPWLHIDIAGPCWFDQDMDWSPKGASGMPVRTIMNYLLNQV
ncbi:MAG: leucyl aminopeptidase [Cyanobacteria bacterium]|nr:leucyl aminopeptidase [Cyanobacteriota bacterium]MDA1021364.1 leucyl aminopeptidase [Cyanobacteriota bacterium]